jgi:Uma2 family endonuclease
MSAQPQPRLTPEEYLEIDRKSEVRHEYYNGRMYAMAGGKYNHARIAANLSAALITALKETPCGVASSDLRVSISHDGLYTYPDIAVVCGEPVFSDTQQDTLTNPVLLIEVLSPSTEAYDRGFKATEYRKLASVQEYAFVSQSEPRIEVLRRQPGGGWLLSETAGLDATCRFESVGCDIALADVYDKIVFEPEDINATRPA